jgi:arginyl-tRNA synthetase
MENSLMSGASNLIDYNIKLWEKTLKLKDEIEQKRKNLWYIDFDDYEINKFLKKLHSIISKEFSLKIEDIELWFLDRSKFKADICIKIPSFLQEYKPKGYMKDIIPKIYELLINSELKSENIIKEIEIVWIYINISFWNTYIFNTLSQVKDLWDKFGELDMWKWENIVMDYSHPNIAKKLHAWHIRSTILGQVLRNIYESAWFSVHSMNHINDWGGFGFLIEWYFKWKDKLEWFESENDMLAFVYTLYRKWEKVSWSEEEFLLLWEEQLNELKEYYWDFNSYSEFVKIFKIFVKQSEKRFVNLENWEQGEFEIWKQIVKWSMDDFQKFYNLLWVHLEYLVWESFYAKMWKNMVLDLNKKWDVTIFTQDHINEEISKLQKLLDDEKIKQVDFDILKLEVENDLWAYLIMLEEFERYVVMKSNWNTIYATRDLASIDYRSRIFNPSRIVYVVWQEQSDHFNKLFQASEKIKWRWKVWYTHAAFWFYLNKETWKKLSSRDWASSVNWLINGSIDYFKNKYIDNQDFWKEEVDKLSHTLALAWIIFNDIKKDKKNPVSISNNIEDICKDFEESGWVYIIYSICRAKSILRRYWKDVPSIENIDSDIELENIEKSIITQFSKFTLIVKKAAKLDNPAILAEYLLQLSRSYNSYYNSCPVLDWDNDHRLIITKSVLQVLINWLKICHLEAPERI